MNFMIGVDCDGCACVVGESGKSLTFSGDFPFAQAQATREADAAARALLDAGADRVVIWDNHGYGANLRYEQLDPRCEVALGVGFGRRWPGLDESFHGAVMIGYHAMAGAADGVCAHTYSFRTYRSWTANGRPVGEIPLDAAVAGEMGVPVICVTSDAAGIDEAAEHLPWAQTVTTKRGVGNHGAFSRHPADVQNATYDAVRQAVDRLDRMQPFTFQRPVRIRIEYKRWAPWLKRLCRPAGWRPAGVLAVEQTFQSMKDWSL